LFVPVATNVTKSRVTGTEIRISYPVELSIWSPEIQASAEKAARRALKQQAEALLFRRLEDLARVHGFHYKSVAVKRLKSRWGSCGPQADITLNIFLMQLPWSLIDYVLLHELVHTKVHNHGRDFWSLFETCLPEAKKLRKQLRDHQPAF
jgi:predicted metal-dependent hydrolase